MEQHIYILTDKTKTMILDSRKMTSEEADKMNSELPDFTGARWMLASEMLKDGERRVFGAYYARKGNFFYGMAERMGKTENLYPKTREEFERDYALVSYITATDKDDAYKGLQAEFWKGWHEVSTAAKDAGVRHTSMSIGDILIDFENDEVLIVAPVGFDKLGLNLETLDLIEYYPKQIKEVK